MLSSWIAQRRLTLSALSFFLACTIIVRLHGVTHGTSCIASSVVVCCLSLQPVHLSFRTITLVIASSTSFMEHANAQGACISVLVDSCICMLDDVWMWRIDIVFCVTLLHVVVLLAVQTCLVRKRMYPSRNVAPRMTWDLCAALLSLSWGSQHSNESDHLHGII